METKVEGVETSSRLDSMNQLLSAAFVEVNYGEEYILFISSELDFRR